MIPWIGGNVICDIWTEDQCLRAGRRCWLKEWNIARVFSSCWIVLRYSTSSSGMLSLLMIQIITHVEDCVVVAFFLEHPGAHIIPLAPFRHSAGVNITFLKLSTVNWACEHTGEHGGGDGFHSDEECYLGRRRKRYASISQSDGYLDGYPSGDAGTSTREATR